MKNETNHSFLAFFIGLLNHMTNIIMQLFRARIMIEGQDKSLTSRGSQSIKEETYVSKQHLVSMCLL